LRTIFAAILMTLIVNIANAETLISGATVCETKEAITALQSALEKGDTKKYQELITIGKCYRVKGDWTVAVTNACRTEVRKIVMNGEPVWCLASQLK